MGYHDTHPSYICKLAEAGQLDKIKEIVEPLKCGITFDKKTGRFIKSELNPNLLNKVLNAASSTVICCCRAKVDALASHEELVKNTSCECSSWRRYGDTALHAAINN